MKIVFFSTNSNYYDEKNVIYTTLPSFETQWKTFTEQHPEHTFLIFTQKPGMFLPINLSNNSVQFLQTNETEEIVKQISAVNPDLAIALSFWVAPFDWLPVKDSIIAEKLQNNGIHTICHSLNTTHLCFDKWETHHFLHNNNFNYAKGVFVKHDLYFCAGNQKDVKHNVYKESVLEQIKKLHFPLIIKDNVGLSSYGLAVVNTFGEVTNYLNSKKNNSDRIIEEYIEGEQFGIEVYGTPGNYSVLPPFKFSLNQYGITSPKLSTKTGPFYDNFETLKTVIIKLAENLKLCGPAQIDLILQNDKWYIIEINPRLSGMTLTYSAALNMSIYEMLFQTCVLHNCLPQKLLQTKNEKHELCTNEQLKELINNPNVKYVSQIQNMSAKQEREKGYCEIISTIKE